MTGSDAMSDSDLLRVVDDSVSAIPAGPRPSVAQIQNIGRARQRRVILAATAAAVVLIGGAGYGVSAAVTGHAPGARGTSTTASALTAVHGCAWLRRAAGTLRRVRGTTLVIKTASGQLVTVTTTASTMVMVSAAPLGDITNGSAVLALGHRAASVISAQTVIIGLPSPSGRYKLATPPGIAGALGTVADASAAGFTLVTASGTRIRVTTSSSTRVQISHASPDQLKTGRFTIAVGHAHAHRMFSAVAVVQPPQGFGGKLQVNNCSASSVDAALTTALITRG